MKGSKASGKLNGTGVDHYHFHENQLTGLMTGLWGWPLCITEMRGMLTFLCSAAFLLTACVNCFKWFAKGKC